MQLRFLFALCLLAMHALRLAGAELADYVNTLQGTNSRFELTHGNTYPTTALPFGMNTWTPQTGRNGDGWKYQYHRDEIRGFQQAHQCSSWSNDYAVFSLMPIVGKLVVDDEHRAVKFRHADETARPYDYRVKLASGVQVEMAPTVRGAYLRFTFPADERAFLVIDGYTGGCSLDIAPDKREVTGSVRNGRNQPENFRNHFVMAFDQPFLSQGTWWEGGQTINADETRIRGRRVGGYLEFAPGATVNVKVASSYVDLAQARRNLARELGDFDNIDAARAVAKQVWNKALGQIRVTGGTDEELRTFYSCLFRASLFPRKFYEYDEQGQPYYRSPYDGQLHKGYMYTDTGLWDTFRAQMPLNALLHPKMHGRYVAAMLAAYEQCGWLPSWSFPGEAGSMIGNHAISVLADAWAKGIHTFDPQQAVAAYQHESTNKGPWGPANGRDGVDEIKRLGYLPYPEHREATAKTLEYAYDDFCGYQLAKAIGDKNAAEGFAGRMFNYRNVYDAETGFVRGRDAAGNWSANFDPTEWGGPFTEGSAWHWTWSVFHDPAGLIDLLGGDDSFVEKLDAVFTAPPDFKVGTYGSPIHEMREMALAGMGQYAHGNQPIQHMIYLYNYAGQPWKSQYWARQVMHRLYNSTEDGYPGDEDQGQTSSWYVLSALGLYCVCPGTDEYVIGSPVFQSAKIKLENGNTFIINAPNNDLSRPYIKSALLNGQPLTRNFLRHEEITAGGELTLEMSAEPNTARGIGAEDRPFSASR
jgi:predicted alpha-1,2-mannosidase